MTRLEDLDDDSDWCAQCGARLPVDECWGRRRFCDKRCANAYFNALTKEAREAAKAGRPCRRCGNPIPAANRGDATVCSTHCRNRIKSYAHLARRFCQTCGAVYQPKQRSQKFCSHPCYVCSRRRGHS